MSKQYNPNDKFSRRAKEQGLRARSAFKLEEIQQKFRLIKPGNKVLDLGAAPGSFLQTIIGIIGEKGFAIGVDLKSIKPFKKPNVKTYVADIFDEAVFEKIKADTGIRQFDVITSDLAPSTTGIKSVDAGRSFELSKQVLAVADERLKPNGHVLLKTFPGSDQDHLLKMMKDRFESIKVFKPKAVRSSSREVYLIGMIS